MTHLRLVPRALSGSLRVRSPWFSVTKRPVSCLVDAYLPSTFVSSFLTPASCRSLQTASKKFTAKRLPRNRVEVQEEDEVFLEKMLKKQIRRTMSSIQFSAGHQTPELSARVETLIHLWKISHAGKGLTRKFTFENFDKAWEFMSIVAEQSKALNHHPDWTNTHKRVKIRWTTQSPSGLSTRDVEMAEFCDKTADAIGQQNWHSDSSEPESSTPDT
ncbi:hypothetical protein J1614_006218 [Plenodomus biglobosus]|nr:hypothetical protein J1614_006218 [Plenodomus biglobosus]